MSAQRLPQLIKPVAPEPIGDRIRLTDEIELHVRRIVKEEMREFLLAQRRAAKLVDAAVMQQLTMTTTA